MIRIFIGLFTIIASFQTTFSQKPTQIISIHFKDTSVSQYQLVNIDSIVHFTIMPAILTSLPPEGITHQSVILGYKLISFGGGQKVETGFCWSTKPNPSLSNTFLNCPTDQRFWDDSILFCEIGGLQRNTIYYAKPWFRNESGVSYGDEIAFKTATSALTVKIEGKEYNTFYSCYGSELIKENLSVTKFINGDSIKQVTSFKEMKDANDNNKPAWCFFDFDPSTETKFGRLYNWYALQDKRGIIPIGWRITTQYDWVSFIGCLGGNEFAGGKMKDFGTIQDGDGLWKSPNIGANNQSGFTGLPSGFVDSEVASFPERGTTGVWWVIDNEYGFYQLNNNSAEITRIDDERPFRYASIRCVKN